MASELPAAAVPASELRARILSSVVMAPVALGAGAVGGLAFAALVALTGAVAVWEWTEITGAAEPAWLRIAALAGLALGLLVLGSAVSGWGLFGLAVILVVAILAGLRLRAAGWMALGLVYVGAPCAAFILLRAAEPSGWVAVLLILLVVWATDIGAYFGGRRLGGPKLWPRVSPKKTWSGAVSGVAAACLAGGLTAGLTGAAAPVAGILLAVPLSVAAQAGDLLESAMKRRFGVKDSGRAIPGHGGVLDRVDGLFGAAALGWLIAALGLGGGLLALPEDVFALSGGAS